jgi:hypothetical protein
MNGGYGGPKGGVWYTPILLPPAGQTSGSWEFTQWTKISGIVRTLPMAGNPSGNLQYIATKANDNTGIYAVFTNISVNPATTVVCQMDRSGNLEFICEASAIAAVDGSVGITPPRGDYDQYCIVGKYYLGPHGAKYINLTTGVSDYMTTAVFGRQEIHPDETVLTMVADDLYTGVPGSLKSSLPIDWSGELGFSYDAKFERLYAASYYQLFKNYGVFRSDDDGDTWALKASGSASSITMNGGFTGHILGHNIIPYQSTYSILAWGGKDSSNINRVYLSPNDGQGFWSSGSWANIVWCVMDMD